MKIGKNKAGMFFAECEVIGRVPVCCHSKENVESAVRKVHEYMSEHGLVAMPENVRIMDEPGPMELAEEVEVEVAEESEVVPEES